jgi:ArsR family transcriptional regulator, virulence genes transcriptional regulator
MNIQDLAPKAADAEDFLKAFANRHRLMNLCELHKGERSVSELRQAVGLSQSALSQHMSRLRADALVATRRESQTIHYSLSDAKVARLIGLLSDLFCNESCEPQKRAAGRRSAKPRRKT